MGAFIEDACKRKGNAHSLLVVAGNHERRKSLQCIP